MQLREPSSFSLLRPDMPRWERIASILSHLSFLLSWLWFSVRLVTHYRLMQAHEASVSVQIAVTFAVLWLYLIREKIGGICLMIACFAFWIASNAVLSPCM